MYKTYKKKIKLDKVHCKIKRLVDIHGAVKLEVYHSGRNGRPYGMRFLRKDGDAKIHYCHEENDFNGPGRQKCCFFENYSEFRNGEGDTMVKKNLIDTIRAMQKHDKGWHGRGRRYLIKRIHAGGRIINVKY